MSESSKPPRVGPLLIELLTGSHGFEVSDQRRGEFAKIVDAQHALVVRDAYWERRGRGKRVTAARLKFMVARRDMNELWRDLLNPEIDEWRGTVSLYFELFAHDSSLPFVDTGHPTRSVEDFLDTWIPQVAAFANLPEIRSFLDRQTKTHYDFVRIPRMMNVMLDGKWDDDAHEEFLAPDIRCLSEFEPDDPVHIACSRSVPLIRAWLEAHPNGIDRELNG